jgi:hypothetical protein
MAVRSSYRMRARGRAGRLFVEFKFGAELNQHQ